MQLDRTALPADTQIDGLDEHREAHRKVDVALGNMHVEAVADERHANQQEKRQRQNLDGWMQADEMADGMAVRCERDRSFDLWRDRFVAGRRGAAGLLDTGETGNEGRSDDRAQMRIDVRCQMSDVRCQMSIEE